MKTVARPSKKKPAAERPTLRLAMLGMIEGNGHPYSWSAIVNGFDADAMVKCPYQAIPGYLSAAEKRGPIGIPGAKVTHVWTDQAHEAPLVARASCIPHVLDRPEDAIGKVDAVMLATDDGFNHVGRARPFVEAGLPVFVDKPLALTSKDLAIFSKWVKGGARILSSSGMRYAPELDPWIRDRSSLGELRWLSGITCKAWENYGIHALEPLFHIIGPGFESVRLESKPGLEVAHLEHRSGAQLTIPVIADGGASFGRYHLAGTEGQISIQCSDAYQAFRRQVLEFVAFAGGGPKPYPFAETEEMMTILIAGIRSRERGSKRVALSEVR